MKWTIYVLCNGSWEDDMETNNFYIALDIQQFHEYTLGLACYISQEW